MSEARIELTRALTKIHDLIQSVTTIEQRKASVSEYYKNVRVGFDEYGNQRVPTRLVDAAKRANEIIKTELVAAVEEECEQQCAAVAMEIDALRVLLPNLAAKACVEIGQVARDIASLQSQEGNGNAA